MKSLAESIQRTVVGTLSAFALALVLIISVFAHAYQQRKKT